MFEQSIIGLAPGSQLVILSATVGEAQKFCQWVYECRREEMQLVESFDRRVPLYHEFREAYLLDVVKDLHKAGDTPAIIFTFGRELCFERARLLKSCARFVTDEERLRIAELCDGALLERGAAKELKPLLLHGIGPDDDRRKPPIKTDDALRNEPGETVAVVLTNPPFGKKSSVTVVNDEDFASMENPA